MATKDNLKPLSGLVCPKCLTEFQFGKTLQNEKQATKKGDLFVCVQCASISIAGDSKLEPMSQGDIQKLDRQSQLMLAAAVAAVRQAQDSKGEIIDLNAR